MARKELPTGWRTKLWGRCATSYSSRTLRCETAEIVRGGYSSWHYHKTQANAFEVVQGELLVRYLDSQNQERLDHLIPGAAPARYAAGVRHQFLALTPVVLQESYTSPSGHDCRQIDIVRFSEGGILPRGLLDFLKRAD